MRQIIKIRQPSVPEDFAEQLRALHRAGDPLLNSVLQLARMNGWNARTLGDALGMSHQAVNQRAARATEAAIGVQIPVPPRKPTKPPALRPRLELKPELIDELREMHAVASTVNGATPADHPSRRVAEQYAAQLDAYIRQGVTAGYLARVLDVTTSAISFRLGRHGYRQLPPSMARSVYRNRQTDWKASAANRKSPSTPSTREGVTQMRGDIGMPTPSNPRPDLPKPTTK